MSERKSFLDQFCQRRCEVSFTDRELEQLIQKWEFGCTDGTMTNGERSALLAKLKYAYSPLYDNNKSRWRPAV